MIVCTQNHKYLVDGKYLIPSVSELTKHATKEDYWGIPEWIVQRAGQFGTEIHLAVEKYYNDEMTEFIDDEHCHCYLEFLNLKDEHIGLNPTLEQMINYQNRYAGRYDLLCNGVLVDIKTNAKFDDKLREHLEWQMGYYALALGDVKECWCLYLPKKAKGKWIQINPKSKDELIRNLESYENLHSMR